MSQPTFEPNFEQALHRIEQDALQTLGELTDANALEAWYRQYLGRKGLLAENLKLLQTLSAEKKPEAGRQANLVKQTLQTAFEKTQLALQTEILNQNLSSAIDVTLPGRSVSTGSIHPCNQLLRRIRSIFAELGFQVYEAPEVDTESNNFTLLNIPPHHPARDMWDTFWLSDKTLLRTHTSPGQIRSMRQHHPSPIRMILPGKCYRYEAVNARSEHQFFQVEGIAIGKSVRLTDLLGTLRFFAERMYGKIGEMRVRGSYFPFTEPSIEVDMACVLCKGKGCRICKHTGWLEVAGAGMMHPEVLKNGGYDPQEWSGFAFGMGVERPLMLLHGIEDIRHFYQNDLRFLKQF